MIPARPTDARSADPAHAAFLTLLPRVETHARVVFRTLPCPDTRADRVADTVALAWTWFVRLRQRGKDPADFPAAFAELAARAVKSGRRVCGQLSARDALSPVARRRGGFAVTALAAADATAELLLGNATTPVPDQVAFRLDWSAFVGSLPARDRDLLGYLALGHAAHHAAAEFGLSCGRVTQLRQRWCADWRRFQAPPPRQR